MTRSTEPRAEGLKPCPFCESKSVHLTSAEGLIAERIAAWEAGPRESKWDVVAELEYLRDNLPRPTTDAVERAAVDLEPLKKLARTWRKSKGLMGPREYQDHPAKMSVWQRTTYHCGKELAEAIRALPSAAGGEDKLREALRRIANNEVEYAGSLAKQYADIAKAALQQEPTK